MHVLYILRTQFGLSMIVLASATDCSAPPRADAGFGWWYADLVDERGDGAVLIWGFAMPFWGRERPGPAAAFPFLNLAVYERGLCSFYHLEDLTPAQVQRVDGGWKMGDSLLTSRRQGEAWSLRAQLRLAVPGSADPVHASLQLDGPATWGGPTGGGPHRWAPLSCGPAQLRLTRGGVELAALDGRGYHDRNDSDVPLAALGIREWAWGRVTRPDGNLVHYACWPEDGGPVRSMALHIGLDGRRTVQEQAPLVESGRSTPMLGFPAPTALEVADPRGGTLRVDSGSVVDRSPFYLRFPLSGGGGRGWGERVRPPAVDLPWMRPFVNMSRLRPGHTNPMNAWFLGPRGDRWQRTVRGLWP